MAQVNTFPLGEIVVTTLWNRSKWIADNVTNSNALLRRLSESGKIKYVSGGREIIQELEYQENDTFLWYSGDDTLTVTAAVVIDAARYEWKQAAVVVRANGLEVNVQNTGKEAVLNLLEARINNAAKTMANQISISIYSDGTTVPKGIAGLQLQVADDPTVGTVGGINRATAGNEFWRNQVVHPTASIDATNIEGYMQQLYMLCTRGADVPDLIPADANFYTFFWSSLMAIQRIQQVDEGQRGWPALKFVNADVVYDGDSGIAADHMYFLNCDYLYWRPHRDVNMVPDDKRLAYDQDAFVIPILFAGNLTMSNGSLQGVLWQDAV